MTPDPQRLERVLAALTPADADWLLAQVAPAVTARSRLDIRDEAIRAAACLLQGGATRRAADLERLLTRYLAAAAWQADKRRGAPSTDASPLQLQVALIALHNDGRGLAWRQLHRVMQGQRTPLPSLS